jgi:hypothetical protein
VPVDGLFVHEGWEDIAYEDAERRIAELEEQYAEEIKDADLQHVDVYASGEYYDEGIKPKDSFSIGGSLNIVFPDDTIFIRNIDTISSSGLDAIKDIVAEHYDYEINDVYPYDDNTIRCELYASDGDIDFEDFLVYAQDLDDHYEEILPNVILVLCSERIIKDEKYEKYLNTVKEIDKAFEDGKQFEQFENIIVTPYSDELGFEILFDNLTISCDKGEVLVRKYGTDLSSDTIQSSYLLRNCVNAIIDIAKLKKSEYYDPKQTLLKDILPEPRNKFSIEDIMHVKDTLNSASGGCRLVPDNTDKGYRVLFRHFHITPKVGDDIDAIFEILHKIDDLYAEFNDALAKNLNSGAKGVLFTNDAEPVEENFNFLISLLQKRRNV